MFSALCFETKLEKATPAPMAFALSLAREGLKVAQGTGFSGGGIGSGHPWLQR